MNKTPVRLGLALGAFTTLLASSADAQHAKFVLFGDPDPQAAGQSAEDRFVHPLTSPYFHEDSFVTSDVRFWYVHHEFTGGSPIGRGDATVIAVQARVALTDRFQFVAYKDGYLSLDTEGIDESGMNNIAAGLKWNFFRCWESNLHLSAGAGYELAAGKEEVLQDYDEWRFWTSANKGFGPLHLGATANYFLPGGSEGLFEPVERLSWHLHADYRLTDAFSPVLEVNGYHSLTQESGSAPFSGVDVANIGGKDEDVITAGLGGEWRFSDRFAARLAYEAPLTDNLDLFGYRYTFSLVYHF
jgi:hypothetical protein